MERRGSGLKRIQDSFIEKNNVEFFSNESSFFVIMKRQNAGHETALNDERIVSGLERFMSSLSETEKMIVNYLAQNPSITSKKAIRVTKLSPAQVRRIFVTLQNKKLILPKGEGRSRHYILAPIEY